MAQRIGFYLVYPLLAIISYLPFPILYGLSDILKVLIRDIIKYRKKVVEDNLRHAFPDKSEGERDIIRDDSMNSLLILFLRPSNYTLSAKRH